MKFKALFRRSFPAVQVWAAIAYPFLFFYGILVFSSYPFFYAFFDFVLAIFASFLVIAAFPALILEMIRRFSARMWKQGRWLSIEERKKTRFSSL